MGIEGLWPYITKKYPRCLHLVPRKSFRNYSVSIDAAGFLYSHYAVAHKQIVYKTDVMFEPLDNDRICELWLPKVMDAIISLMSNGILPVFVFDGTPVPEKIYTLEKRSSNRQHVQERFDKIKDVKATDILFDDSKVLDEARLIMSQMCSIPRDSMNMMKGFMYGLGIPVLTGRGDGERLASMLCKQGITAATLSEDGDCLAHLSNYLIRHNGDRMVCPQTGSEVDTFEIVDLEILLEDIGMTRSMFQDFCIMCGTDYNNRIPQVGPGRAHGHITNYRSIYAINWNEIKKDPTPLMIESTKKLFMDVPFQDLIEQGDLSIKEWDSSIADHLSMYQMDRYIQQWHYMMTNREQTYNFIHRFDRCIGNMQMYRSPGEYNIIPGMIRKDQANVVARTFVSKYKKTNKKDVKNSAPNMVDIVTAMRSSNLNITEY